MSKTYQEIHAQYAALQQTFHYMQEKKASILRFFEQQQPASITFIGCGSSFCLSEAAAFQTSLRTGRKSIALAGGDLLLHAGPYSSLLQDTLLVAPSRSGSTSEIVEAVRLVRSTRKDAPVLALSCVADSPLGQIADFTLELPWAFDESVCQTRTVTNLYMANLLLAAFLAGDERLESDIKLAIEQGEAYMARYEAPIRKVADFAWTNAVVLADGELYGLAAEGAIALTEIARVQAKAHHLLDVRHGPMVTVGPDTLVIAALSAQGSEHQRNLMRDIKARGATIIAYADQAALIPPEVDLAVASEAALDPAAQGLPFIYIPQLVAVASAERHGFDPDQPDGLTAWVKL